MEKQQYHGLQVFFQLPGRILWGTEKVEVGLKRFNDRALNRDLETLCAKVAQEQPRLPDGRRLLFRVQGTSILRLKALVFSIGGLNRPRPAERGWG